jgi:hypothetical protein
VVAVSDSWHPHWHKEDTHPWINTTIRRRIGQKQRPHKKAKKTKKKKDMDRYQRLKQKVQWEIRQSMDEYVFLVPIWMVPFYSMVFCIAVLNACHIDSTFLSMFLCVVFKIAKSSFIKRKKTWTGTRDLNRKYNGKSDKLTRNIWKKLAPITKTTRKNSCPFSFVGKVV